MKKITFTLAGLLCSLFAFAQLNMSLVSQVQYQQNLNDVWGWVDPDTGEEYAIVGTTTGTSIVSLADPANAVEVQFIPGPQSTWRDIKSWDHYVFVTNETDNGLLVIDMSGHPNNITWFDWEPMLTDVDGQTKQLDACHNLYIDEFGWCYLAGCNLNNGGMLFVDVFSTPGTPQFVGYGASVYAHDVYARDNRMYASEIYGGNLTIYDVTDKLNVQALASQQTPFAFTHNAWLNDAGDVVFTTDEQANAPVAAYDISDLSDIKELDQFVPIATLGTGVIPHNVHVWQDWLIISYYTDGGIIVDASKPDNLIEVGNFDTFFGGSGFSGVWGAYPFLPSGLVLLTDIGNGLYVMEPNYVRACWLEGTVTSSQTGAPIANATIEINSAQPNLGTTDINGKYQTGQALPGTFDVLFQAPGFYPKTVSAELENGVLTTLDVQLDPFPNVDISGKVVRASDGAPIPNARVFIHSLDNNGDFASVTDANGDFSLSAVVIGNYEIKTGAWGYHSIILNDFPIDLTSSDLTIELEQGYRDEFLLDLGWETESTATTGDWELGEPVGTNFQGGFFNPEFDVDDDLGDWCYVTGNGGGGAGNDDVDNGVVTLISPPMDLTGYNEPILNYRAWFRNGGGQGTPPNDALEVRISNGTDEVVVETITESLPVWRPSPEVVISDLLPITSNMRVIFETSDLPGSGHLVEAAVDAFEITEGSAYPPFQVSALEGCMPFTVVFQDMSDSTIAYNWTFENGNPATSNEANPTVVWNAPGTYDVTLEVQTESGNYYTVTRENLITVRGLPLSDFNFSVQGAVASFVNLSDDADSFTWDFGDGNGSSEANPTHVYGAPGTYTVTLIATNPCANHTTTQVVVVDAIPPTAAFTASGTGGCAPYTVQFTDQSQGEPTAWNWQFPGGIPDSSTEPNPVVVYNVPGVYSVFLEVSNSAGQSEFTETQFITIEMAPTAEFDFVEDMGTVTFSNLSVFGESYMWDFGDGSTSTEFNPSHMYSANGDYQVTLTVTNNCGTIGFTQIINISSITGLETLDETTYNWTASPNPFNDRLHVQYEIEAGFSNARLVVFNILGQQTEAYNLRSPTGSVDVLTDGPGGIYFLQLEVDGKMSRVLKAVKSE